MLAAANSQDVDAIFTDYAKAAMKKAKYELMEDRAFWGEIPGFQGVWEAPTTWSPAETTFREL